MQYAVCNTEFHQALEQFEVSEADTWCKRDTNVTPSITTKNSTSTVIPSSY